IDIYAVRLNGRYRVWQCKQYADIDKIDVVKAAQDFLVGPWADRAENFTFCTSLLVADTAVEDDAVAARKLLAEHDPPIAFEFWDGREISHLLEHRPEEVYAFFGPDHYRRFIGPGARGGDAAALATLSPFASVAQPQTQVRIVSLPVAPAQVREAFEQLRSEAPTELVTLLDLLGEPPRPGRA